MVFFAMCLKAQGALTKHEVSGWPAALLRLPEPRIFNSTQFNLIEKIRADNKGFIWLSTDRGLFRFDGSLFRKIIHSKGGNSPVDQGQINDMLFDEEGNRLWVATDMGVSVLDLRTETFTDYTFHQSGRGDTDGECTSICKDRQGMLWFGVMGLGLVGLTDTGFRYFPMPKGPEFSRMRDFPTIYQIAQDVREDSILWFAGGTTGLTRFNSVKGIYTSPKPAFHGDPAELVKTTLFSTRDKIYLGNTWKVSGGTIYDIRGRTFKPLENKNPDFSEERMKIGDFQCHSPGAIWGFTDDGLILIDTRRDSVVAVFPNPGASVSINCNFLVLGDRIWLALDKGLFLYDFSRYTVENHLFKVNPANRPDIIRTVLEKKDGTGFWLGFMFSDYLYDYNRKRRTFRVVPPHEKGENDAPATLFRLEDGRTIAIGHGGIYELKDNRLLHLPIMQDLFAEGKEIGGKAMLDRKGNLWLNSRTEGLYRIDLNTGYYENRLEGRYFMGTPQVFMDSRDRFWLSGRGFSVYDPGKDTLIHFPYLPGARLTTHFPRDFEEDDAGNIWMCDARVGGLMMVDPRHLEKGIVRRLEARNGPGSNLMWALKKDGRGRIWAVTKVGVQVFDPKTETFKLFGSAAGFQLRQEGYPAIENLFPAYLTRLSTGEMVAGYHNGFAVFHPDSLVGNSELPKPYLISVSANEQKLTKGTSFGSTHSFMLKHFQNVIGFEYSGIAFYEPAKVRYRYRLKGYDKKWLETSRRYIRYTHLPPGRYSFQLLALNSDGLHADAPLEWRFRVLAPWWASWWAYGMYILLLFAGIYSIYRYKRSQWRIQVQLEMEHREAERLKELDGLKTRLYTNITHEFRTPLTVILGMVEQIRSNPREWYSEGLQMIRRNGQNLLRLVNQMLDLSKVEAGAMPVHPVQGDVLAFLKYILESFHSLAEGKNIGLRFEADADEFFMDYDPEKLREIVSNLISNAIKFTPEGGSVVLSVVTEDPRNFHFFIKDNGVGIPPEKLPFIFDRFFQVDDGIARGAGGTGIGLTLTKELIRLLGGEISVNSEPGTGTEFLIRLPVKREAEPERPMAMPDPLFAIHPAAAWEAWENPGENGHEKQPLALLVEDNADVITYLRSILGKDYRIECAPDGQKGLELAVESIPDIIISDVMMPVMDGFELCRRLKTDMRTSHIPIILLTARADMASKIEGLKHGADAYLAKPFDQAELSVRLENLIELRRQLRARYGDSGAPLSLPSPSPLEDDFMSKVRTILESHLGDEDFDVTGLCKTLAMSRPQLYRKFQALTDQPIAQYFRKLRLQRARTLLLSTQRQVSEIAFEVGFKDPAYFARAFKEAFGQSPSEMRRG